MASKHKMVFAHQGDAADNVLLITKFQGMTRIKVTCEDGTGVINLDLSDLKRLVAALGGESAEQDEAPAELWVLSRGDYADRVVVGVVDSEQKANLAKATTANRDELDLNKISIDGPFIGNQVLTRYQAANRNVDEA